MAEQTEINKAHRSIGKIEKSQLKTHDTRNTHQALLQLADGGEQI